MKVMKPDLDEFIGNDEGRSSGIDKRIYIFNLRSAVMNWSCQEEIQIFNETFEERLYDEKKRMILKLKKFVEDCYEEV